MTGASTLTEAERGFLRAFAFAPQDGSSTYQQLQRLEVEMPCDIAGNAVRELLSGRNLTEAMSRALYRHPVDEREFREVLSMILAVSDDETIYYPVAPVKIACLLLALEGPERCVAYEAIIKDLRQTEARRDRTYLLFTVKHALEAVAA